MGDTELPNGDLLTDEVNVELYVLGAPMMSGVPRHVYRRYVVVENHSRGRDIVEKFIEKVS